MSRTRKHTIHERDPLDDLDIDFVDEPGHTRYAPLYDAEVSGAGYWADWLVQTVSRTAVSDQLESVGAGRHFTIQAVLFSADGDELVVTANDGERFAIRYDAVMLDNVRTTRHG